MMIKTDVTRACIFDLDGVIVDSARYHFLAWKRLAAELGIELTEQHNERLKGVSRMDSLDIILSLGGKQLSPEEKQELADKKNSWFVDYIEKMEPSEIYPGVREIILSLKKKGIKVALASSSKNARTILRLLGIQDLFDAVVDGTMIINSKPDPEIFLRAANMLNVKPSECIVFEDAEAGVEAAVAAGMRCIGIGSPEQLRKANLILKNTGDYKFELIDAV